MINRTHKAMTRASAGIAVNKGTEIQTTVAYICVESVRINGTQSAYTFCRGYLFLFPLGIFGPQWLTTVLSSF